MTCTIIYFICFIGTWIGFGVANDEQGEPIAPLGIFALSLIWPVMWIASIAYLVAREAGKAK